MLFIKCFEKQLHTSAHNMSFFLDLNAEAVLLIFLMLFDVIQPFGGYFKK